MYYRSGRPPFFPPRPDLNDEHTRARLTEFTAQVTPDVMERDGAAYVDFLASFDGVSSGPLGVGFCFTGAFALRIAAARSDKIAAAASFHGGGAYESETYNARHGWTVPDSAAYDEAEAERAFTKLRDLFATMSLARVENISSLR